MENTPTERFISQLLESRYSLTRSLSELSSLKSVFDSIENSLKNSVGFYKSQLDKSELQTQASIDSLTTQYNKLYEKFKIVSEQVMKNSESEVQMLIEIDSLKKQLGIERKSNEELREANRKLEESVKFVEMKAIEREFRGVEEKNEIFKKYLDAIAEANQKVYCEKVEDGRMDEDVVGASEEKESKQVFPVADVDGLVKSLRKSRSYKKKYIKLQSLYEELESATNALLVDIENRSPEMIAERDKYQELQSRYKAICQDFDEYKQKYIYQKEHFPKCLEIIETQKSKIFDLNSKIFDLTSENYKLKTGSDLNPDSRNKFITCMDQNTIMSKELQNLTKTLKTLQSDLSQKQEKLEEQDQELQQLKLRSSIMNSISSSLPSALSQYEHLMLKQELESKDSSLTEYKKKFSQTLQEKLKLTEKIQESENEIKDLSSKVMSMSQELFILKTSKPSLSTNPSLSSSKEFFQGFSVDNFEASKKIEVILKENEDLCCKVKEAYKEIQKLRIDWAEEVARLQSENDVLRLLSNSQDADKLRDELGSTKAYLREIRCLLDINEKELSEERTKRMHCEKSLKRLRTFQLNYEKHKMHQVEISDLSQELSHFKDLANKLAKNLSDSQENLKKSEESHQKSLNSLADQLQYQQKTNEVHQKNIKTLSASYKELSETLEKKKSECQHLESYLQEKESQRLNIENLLTGKAQNKDHLHFMLHNRVESFLELQDKDSYRSISQIESFKAENARLKEEQNGMKRVCESLREELEWSRRQNESLADKVKRSEEIYKQPEVLKKIVRLVHRSTGLCQKQRNN